MRIATYNVEWFANLFDDAGNLIDNNSWSGWQDVTKAEQAVALARVFQAINADAIMIIEAPDISPHRDGRIALETFAAYAGLRARKALAGFPNETQQEIILLYDPDTVSARHDPKGDGTSKKGSDKTPRFDGVFRLDLDVDAAPDLIRWSKPPLEAVLKTKGRREVRMIGVHAKSKAPHGAQEGHAAFRISIENRSKQLAQCIWLRQRIEQHLEDGDDLIVLGDLNDGPGLDDYESSSGARASRSSWAKRARPGFSTPTRGWRSAKGSARSPQAHAFACRPMGAISRPCSTTSWSRPSCTASIRSGASGTRLTIL